MENPELDFEESLKQFPCMIVLEKSINVDHQRLKDLQKKLQAELDKDNDYKIELVQKLNVYTWVEFKLSDRDKARELNKRVLELDEGSVTALGNLAYLNWVDGEEDLANEYLRKLRSFEVQTDATSIMAVGKAQIGYAYSRLGGVENIEKAIEIYKEVLAEKPDFINGKLCLGLLLRRITHNNLSAEFKFKTEIRSHFETAATALFEAGESGEDDAVQGRAYAELALLLQDAEKFLSSEVCRETFRGKDILHFCEKALEFGSENARTVAECGRILKDKHLDRAIELLEKSFHLRPHTIACHHLGICYERKAKEMTKLKMIENNVNNDSVEDVVLNPEDELVKKAISNYNEAIKLSNNTNLSAVYSLGLCLKACGLLDKAVRQFNKITVTAYTRTNVKRRLDHIVTLINSYEQAGLCLLQVSKPEEAEKKLMQAVSLAATVVASRPDLNTHTKHIWNALVTIEDVYNQKPPESVKILFDLLSNIGHHGKVLRYFEKLRELGEDYATHPDVVVKVLESFTALKDYDKAYTTLTMLRTQASFRADDELILKINIYTAASRLVTGEGDTESIFKDVFDNNFRQKDIVKNGENGADQYSGVSSNVAENTKKEVSFLDILIINNQEDQDESEEITQKLMNIIKIFFGLEVSCNLEGCLPGRFKDDFLLKEIQRSKLTIFLLNNEPLSRDLRTILPFVRSTCGQSETIGSDISVTVTDDKVNVPSYITDYRRMNLMEDFKELFVDSFNHLNLSGQAFRLAGLFRDESSESPVNLKNSNVPISGTTASKSDTTTSNVVSPSLPGSDTNSSDQFTPEVNALMKLFCFLINRKWPTLEKLRA